MTYISTAPRFACLLAPSRDTGAVRVAVRRGDRYLVIRVHIRGDVFGPSCFSGGFGPQSNLSHRGDDGKSSGVHAGERQGYAQVFQEGE